MSGCFRTTISCEPSLSRVPTYPWKKRDNFTYFFKRIYATIAKAKNHGWPSRERDVKKKKEKKFLSIHDDHLRITFSISMNRQPSEWLAGSRDLRSSLIRASVIPGEVRSAVSNALRSSSIAPPFLPMPLPPSPLLSLAEYWCFLWSYAQEQRN